MLQPRQPQPQDQLLTARILWVALTASAVMYGIVLLVTGKVSIISFPENTLSPIEMGSLGANFISLFVFWFYKNKVESVPGIANRFPGYIICWALSESIALIGFVAVFITDSGNGFFYLVNLLITVVLNVLTFPKNGP